jgi:predicted permease
MQSLTYTVDALRWGAHDTREAMQGRALTYLVLFSTLGIILRWSYGIKLLSTADAEPPKPDVEDGVPATENGNGQNGTQEIEAEQGHNDRAPLLERIDEDQETATNAGNTPRAPRFSDGPATLGRPGPSVLARRKPERRWTALGNGEDLDDADFFQRSLSFTKNRSFRKEISEYRSFPNTPSRTPAASTYTTSDEGDSRSVSDDDEDDYEGAGRRNNTEQSTSAFQAKMRRSRKKTATFFRQKIWKPFRNFMRGVQAFMTAPLYAALLSLIVGRWTSVNSSNDLMTSSPVACIPPVQKFLDELLPVRK